jgi:hypothetical protein
LARIWKEAVVTQFGVLYYPGISLEVLKKTTKTSVMIAGLGHRLSPEPPPPLKKKNTKQEC